MKKISISIVTILAVVSMVTGATQSVFSSSDSMDGNTVTTARLSIDAIFRINKPLGDIELLPNQWGDPGTVDLYNDGNSPQRQWMHITNISGNLCNYVKLKVGYSTVGWNVFSHTYGTYTLSQLKGASNARLVGRSDPVAGNNTTRLVQQAYVVASTPNTLQNSTCTWDEVFTATQPGYGMP